jgi:ferredoxin
MGVSGGNMSEAKEKKVDEIKKESDGIKCPVKQALYYIGEFLDGPMCGKCFPCKFGSYDARTILEGIVSGTGTEADLNALRKIADEMLVISRCKRGKDTAKFTLEWLDIDAFRRHIKGECPDRQCIGLTEYTVIPEKCIMCGLCQDACKDNAIVGEKKVSYRSGYLPYEIRQKRCTKCGECVEVCPVDAIKVEFINIAEEVPV